MNTIDSIKGMIVTEATEDQTENQYFGKDCPKGMVQVEFVGCDPKDKRSEYGWKPTKSAFIDVYVDGKRFRIDVGDFHDGNGQRRGLHIVTDLGIEFEKTACNAASLFFTEE